MSYPALTASPPRFARPVFPWRSGLAKKVKTNIKISKKSPVHSIKKNIQGNSKLQTAAFITVGLFRLFSKNFSFQKNLPV